MSCSKIIGIQCANYLTSIVDNKIKGVVWLVGTLKTAGLTTKNQDPL